MDMQDVLTRKILIRLTDPRDGFVATVRYGPLFRRSEAWAITPQEEAVGETRVDESSCSEESGA